MYKFTLLFALFNGGIAKQSLFLRRAYVIATHKKQCYKFILLSWSLTRNLPHARHLKKHVVLKQHQGLKCLTFSYLNKWLIGIKLSPVVIHILHQDSKKYTSTKW